jgi:hypothetical protein
VRKSKFSENTQASTALPVVERLAELRHARHPAGQTGSRRLHRALQPLRFT